MKKILHIVESMGGGVFTYIVDLSNQLCEEYDVYIAYAVRPQTPANYKEYFDNRINLIEVKNFNRSVDFVKDIKAFKEIRQITDTINPDVIHLHSSKAGVLGRWAFNGEKTPLMYTPHGYSFLMQNCGFLKRTVYKAIESITSKRTCTTVSCSLGEHKETLKMTSNATIINNGINIEELKQIVKQNSASSGDNQKFTCFTLGRICYQKNPELFNDVAKELPEIKFVWIGDGELREKLTSPNIEITGWVNRDLALRHAANADAFILTSLWEGLPISLLESMYMKKVCIVSNVIGNNDVIQDGVNGYVCNNLEDFVHKLKNVSLNENNLVVNNAYQNILTEYNINVMGFKYKNIYNSLIMNKGAIESV